MSAALRIVEPERRWVEVRSDDPVARPTSDATWHLGLPTWRTERLRSIAVTVWLSWLIVAGVIVGGTALVVLVRIAAVVLRWAVAA